MKTKIVILVALVTFLSACSKTEVVAPPPVVPTPEATGTSSPTPEVLPQVEVLPKDVQGAEVTGKAQDMPEGPKEGEHSSDPMQAPTVGEAAPIPVVAPNPVAN